MKLWYLSIYSDFKNKLPNFGHDCTLIKFIFANDEKAARLEAENTNYSNEMYSKIYDTQECIGKDEYYLYDKYKFWTDYRIVKCEEINDFDDLSRKFRLNNVQFITKKKILSQQELYLRTISKCLNEEEYIQFEKNNNNFK